MPSDALIISDLHLGARNCRDKPLRRFLSAVAAGDMKTERLVLGGDVYESPGIGRLNAGQWEVLSLLRKISKRVPVIWVRGNHDPCEDFFAHCMGVDVHEQLVFESGPERVLVMHGDQFDDFLHRRPVVTALADKVYGVLQAVDKSHGLARAAKRSSKAFLRCVDKVRDGAVARAGELGCSVVVCGHTHFSQMVRGDITYVNSGCFTENPCTYVRLKGGQPTLLETE